MGRKFYCAGDYPFVWSACRPCKLSLPHAGHHAKFSHSITGQCYECMQGTKICFSLKAYQPQKFIPNPSTNLVILIAHTVLNMLWMDKNVSHIPFAVHKNIGKTKLLCYS